MCSLSPFCDQLSQDITIKNHPTPYQPHTWHQSEATGTCKEGSSDSFIQFGIHSMNQLKQENQAMLQTKQNDTQQENNFFLKSELTQSPQSIL